MANRQIVRQQKPELEIVVHLGQNPIPVIDGIVGVDVVLEINPVIPTGDSPPLDLCIVVDCSGSMGDRAGRKAAVTKIEAVRTALTNIVQKMSLHDRIRVIGFSDRAFEILPWKFIDSTNIPRIVRTLDQKLQSDASTFFAGALKMVLDDSGIGMCGLPNVVLLTDGQSSDKVTDHPSMITFVDTLRARKIPLVIYGTGPDYEWSLLQQLAIRAGNGSLLYHVLSVQDLESHLTGELAFRHGLCLEDVTVSVFHAMAKIRDVYRFVPQEFQIQSRNAKQNLNDVYQNHQSFLYEHGNGFHSACGPVDYQRGQKFLFRVEIPLASFQEDCLFNVTIMGNKPGEPKFQHIIRVPATCSTETTVAPMNKDVELCIQMVAASKAVQEGDIARGAQIYASIGQNDLAQTLVQMVQAGEDDASTTRSTHSVAASAVSTVLTADMMQQLRGQLENKP